MIFNYLIKTYVVSKGTQVITSAAKRVCSRSSKCVQQVVTQTTTQALVKKPRTLLNQAFGFTKRWMKRGVVALAALVGTRLLPKGIQKSINTFITDTSKQIGKSLKIPSFSKDIKGLTNSLKELADDIINKGVNLFA